MRLTAKPECREDARRSSGWPPQDPPRIKPGVSAAGVELSGLTVREAAAKLDAELLPRLQGDFVLTTAGRHWPLSMKDAGLKLDSTRTAKRALYAKVPAGTPIAVAPAIEHSRAAVKAFVARVAAKVRHAPRDAAVRISLRRVRVTHSHTGKALAQVRTRRRSPAAFGPGPGPCRCASASPRRGAARCARRRRAARGAPWRRRARRTP